jgi:hypothetical protein
MRFARIAILYIITAPGLGSGHNRSEVGYEKGLRDAPPCLRALALNGRTIRLTLGGAAPKSLQDASIATLKPGQSVWDKKFGGLALLGAN